MRVSPSARKSKALSAAAKLTPTEPAPEWVLSARVVDRAPSSTACRPAGRAPPDQAAVAPLVDTAWLSLRSTSVKASTAEAESAAEPAVTPAISPVMWSPASAESTGASLAPVTVKVTGWTEVAPWASVTVTV